MPPTTWTAPVRYAETDQQGVAFNAHYLAWCDEAMTAWLEQGGLPYARLLEAGTDTMVKRAELVWTAPVRYGDAVQVEVRGGRCGTTSFVVHMSVRAGGRECCAVDLTYVAVDSDGRPHRVPDLLRALLHH